jgi:RNA polymerase sigma-70 factor (ECF subfamily)
MPELSNSALALHPDESGAPRARAQAAEVVSAHYDFVWRLLRRMGVEAAAAEDAAQEVFCVYWRRIGEVRAGSERAFLCGTALQVARAARRQAARQVAAREEQVAALISEAPAVDDVLDAERARRALDAILQRLSEELRAVFVLCEIEEMTMAEVALCLGVPAGTVASRLRRARELVANAVANERGPR